MRDIRKRTAKGGRRRREPYASAGTLDREGLGLADLVRGTTQWEPAGTESPARRYGSGMQGHREGAGLGVGMLAIAVSIFDIAKCRFFY